MKQITEAGWGKLGRRDHARFQRANRVILVGVLKGSAIFLADLARQIKLDATFDFVGVTSYGNRPTPTQELKSGWDSTGEVEADERCRPTYEG